MITAAYSEWFNNRKEKNLRNEILWALNVLSVQVHFILCNILAEQ